MITAPDRSPVVIESEYLPAATVEQEARSRLGLGVTEGRDIEAAIALRIPTEVGDADALSDALLTSKLSYCLFTEESIGEDGVGTVRFPESGWLNGSVTDLADLVRLVSVPQKAVDQAAKDLQKGIDAASNILEDMHKLRPGITGEIARLLGMENVPQTRRMASAILANAMIFHERIAGRHTGIRNLNLVCGPDVPNPHGETLASWRVILNINYYPIFAIGRDILSQLPADVASGVLQCLYETATKVNKTGVNNAHDLTGRVFQRLISDRKYLATFYTLPASAALLARLAVAKMEGVDWGDVEAIGNLKVGDFVCGTGALLSAVYEQISSHHESAGGDAAAIHTDIMEEVLYGCDVMPSAIHITGSTLAGVQPEVDYANSRLYTMPYGRQDDETVKIGSLEFLQSSAQPTLFNTSDPALRTGSAGEETAAHVNVEVPDEGFDLVIMNPPFTRATNHGGSHANVVNPAVAAYNASEADQADMGDRIGELGKGTCYHGNAGIASAFVALANRKLKPGGVLALVLPLVATAGLSWQSFRQMLARNYTDLTALSLAAENVNDMSFSADTGLGECLIVARKLKGSEVTSGRAYFTSLKSRPQGFAQANTIAKGIIGCNYVRQIEDGPYGGTPLIVGEELAGEMLIAHSSPDGEVWGSVRLFDYSLAQTAFALTQSQLWLPGQPTPLQLTTAKLGEVGKLGLVHRDITGPPPRGPFNKIAPSPTATYPALWNHDAKKEIRIVCEPDSQLQVRVGMESKAAMVWATASRGHLNLELRYNSQPLAVVITEMPSVGGRAWPNIGFGVPEFDFACAIWGNSTLGLISHWWHSSRQDSGRGSTTIRSAETLHVLDFSALSDEQLATAEGIFDEFRELDLMPAYLADADPNRALLDRRVVCDLLGFDKEVYRGVRRLAQKWCAEPSVHGGKARPKSAEYVE